jgi:predicted metal-dependent hydrolase
VSIQTSLPYNRVSIRGQKTRWGSCSSDKNINLNYKLLFLEPEFVKYIIIHELCHTIHLNHSREFWQLVGDFYPDYRDIRKQIIKYCNID